MDSTPSHSFSARGLTVLIPAYNEEGAIAKVVSEVQRAAAQSGEPIELLVIDDGSTDSTALRAVEAGARVVSHHENIGYGAALKTGIRAAEFDTILMLDADGTYPADAIPALLSELAQCDMVVAARTGSNVNIPAARKPAKWILLKTAEFLADRPIPDLNSGMRAFRRADGLRYLNLYPRGFSFTTTITLAFLSNDLRVSYVPIDYHERIGHSKLRPIRDTKNLFLTVIRCILLFNPLRVCVPVGLVLFAISLVFALFIRDSQGHIMDGTITILVTSGLQIIIVGFLADILSRLRQ
jgi:glycosyltransferase involved in cell wall biosynthesis